jgi:membrane fusion protein (multidrug efflux system)
MVKRMLVMVAVMLVIIAALGFVKFRQIQTAMAEGAAFQPPPEAVTTIVAQQEAWPATLTAIGTVAAVHGVTISADLPGTVDRITFESGRAVSKGDVLAQLDTRQERAQLEAIEAQRELARVNYERLKGLLSERVISQAEFDRAAAEQKETVARVGEVNATIERKTIRAPFAGVLGIRQANLGQYLAAGDPIVPLQSLDPIFVNFGVPQQDMPRIRRGHRVAVSATDAADVEIDGRVTAIDSLVDETTRNVQIQATFANAVGILKPGMFVQAHLQLGSSRTVIALPASAISYAPFGDSVFIVADLKGANGQTYRGVRQQFVKLGGARGDQIAVLSGIEPGQEIVTSGVFKLRNGAAVLVNNTVQPGNKRAPRPEDS